MNNTWLAFGNEAIAASVALAHRLGLTTETVEAAIAEGPLVSPWQSSKLQRIARDDFSPQFALSLALKDIRLAVKRLPSCLPLPAWQMNGNGRSIRDLATWT